MNRESDSVFLVQNTNMVVIYHCYISEHNTNLVEYRISVLWSVSAFPFLKDYSLMLNVGVICTELI